MTAPVGALLLSLLIGNAQNTFTESYAGPPAALAQAASCLSRAHESEGTVYTHASASMSLQIPADTHSRAHLRAHPYAWVCADASPFGNAGIGEDAAQCRSELTVQRAQVRLQSFRHTTVQTTVTRRGG